MNGISEVGETVLRIGAIMFLKVKNVEFSVIVNMLNLTWNSLDRLWHHFRMVGEDVFLCGAGGMFFSSLGFALSLNFIERPFLCILRE